MIQIEPEEAFLLSPFVFASRRRLPEAGKNFAIFELLRTCIKESIVAMLSPTILFSSGGGGAREGAQWCSLTRYIGNGARTVRAQSIFSTRAPSEHEYLQLGSVLNDKRRAPAPRLVCVHPWRREAAQGWGAGTQAFPLRRRTVYLIYLPFFCQVYFNLASIR